MDAITQTLAGLRTQLTAAGAPFELTTVVIDGASYRAYAQAHRTLPDLINSARTHAAKPFIVYGDETWTYAAIFEAADALARGLTEGLGVRPGDRVAIAMRNRPEWVVAFLGAALAGAVPAPLNSFGLHDELLDACRLVEPRVLIADADRLRRLGDDWSAVCAEAVVCDGKPAPGSRVHHWDSLARGPAAAAPSAPVEPQDPALLLFTSGASARPKAVLTTHVAVCQAIRNIDFIAASSAMSSPRIIDDLMRRGLVPTTLTVVPLFHISGLHAQLLSSLVNGRRLVFMHRWDAALAIDLIRRHRVTQVNAAPTMIMQLLEHPGFDFAEMRQTLAGIGFGGAGLPQRLIGEVIDGLGPSMSGVGFGMTESSGVGTAMSGEAFRTRPTSSGVVSPIADLRIVDLEDRVLPDGEAGEIQLRGVAVMREYRGQPEATSAAIRDGWLRTGDVGYVEDGYLYVVDRLKNVINRAGEKIAAAEVESCLLQNPALAEVAVVGVDDPVHGEAVAAAVVPVAGAEPTEAELQAFVAERLAAYKVPSRIVVRREPLPKNPAGKLLKAQLKRELSADGT